MSEQRWSRVGELRTSQLLHTFGIGAVADMPNLSVIIRGLDRWDRRHATPVTEDRLLAAVRSKLGPQVSDLRSPPYTAPTPNVFEPWTQVGVPVAPFPRWLRCTRGGCNRLGPVDASYFELVTNQFRPDRSRYVHACYGQGNRRPSAVPARFVLACDHGHLDDFPWLFFAHRGDEPTPGDGTHTLKLTESGTSGEAANVYVQCSCEVPARSMADALGPANAGKNLPVCRGRHPHLGTFEDCQAATRVLALGATNSWFPMQIRVFSLPRDDNPLDHVVVEHWPVLSALTTLPPENAHTVVKNLPFWPTIEHHGFDTFWKAVQARATSGAQGVGEPTSGDEIDLAGPEWRAFTRPAPVALPDFTTQPTPPPPQASTFLNRVVLVPRLREVSALYGFTRIDAPEFDVLSTSGDRVAPISAEPPNWVPCAEQRGEGIFLRFDEAAISEWEKRPAVRQRERRLRIGHQSWRAARGLDSGQWPGARYLMLHSFAHALIREFSLESGYSAAGIAERIYARGEEEPMAGVLLYTAAADSEGTLGGLVSLGQDPARLDALIAQALESARLCSSDPLCAEYDPAEHARLAGAACHACQFAAETSCERGNHYLDRALVVDTIAAPNAGAGFFR